MSKVEWPYITPGIPDEMFKRVSGVPMTRQEVRVISISKLRLFPGAVVYDVGAGTGSISVECAIQVEPGTVYALERDGRADEVLEANVRKFGLTNIKLVPGFAPATMEKLPLADRIFIGGNGGALAEILATADKKLKPGGWLVANSVTAETGPEVYNFLVKNKYAQVDAITVNIAKIKQAGNAKLWQANNPVQIISGQKPRP